jgi:hypothetical protein
MLKSFGVAKQKQRKFMVVNAYIKNEGGSDVNNVTLSLKEL